MYEVQSRVSSVFMQTREDHVAKVPETYGANACSSLRTETIIERFRRLLIWCLLNVTSEVRNKIFRTHPFAKNFNTHTVASES